MGILGSLLYPDNDELAKELNDKEDKLQKTNALHNDFVNSYRAVGEATKSFDAYLMAIMVMQYHLAYTEEDLQNLPSEQIPQLTQYWADTVETDVLDVLTVKMAVDGFKAITNGVANLFREGGIFRRASPLGDATLAKELGSEVQVISARAPVVRTASVELLTTEQTGAELKVAAEELTTAAAEVSKAVEAAPKLAETSSEVTTEVTDMANTGKLAGEAAAEGASLSSKLASGFMAALGPALLIATVVTEILSAIHAGQEHAQLLDAANRLDDAQKQLDDSLESIKKVYHSLLMAAKTDITAYNKMLPDLYAVEGVASFQRQPFSIAGIDSFISGMDAITIDQGGIPSYQAVTLQNLSDATSFISQQAQHDATMTQVVKQIKTHMRVAGIKDLPDNDPFLQQVASVFSVTVDQAVIYNKFRRTVAQYGSMLLPYHRALSENQGSGIVTPPSTVPTGEADPNFDPNPSQFTIPGVSLGTT